MEKEKKSSQEKKKIYTKKKKKRRKKKKKKKVGSEKSHFKKVNPNVANIEAPPQKDLIP